MAYTPHQRRVAFHLYDVGRKKGASRKQILAALETGLVESNLGNPRGGDGTSSGWRQQIAGAGVKSQNRQNIRKQAGYFYDEIKGAKGARAGDLAAAVQRPAAQYRGRYNENAKQASDLLHYLEKTYGRGGGKGGSRTVGGDLQGKLVKTPGVDNSALRTQIQQSYLRPGGKMPSQTALLSMAGQLSQAQDVPGETSLKLSRSKVRKVRTGGGGGGRSAYPVRGAAQGRVDMGVDFTHHGPVKAMADGVVVNAASGGTGWPGGGWVSYKLTSGPHKGRIVFVAENVSPRVKPGQRVRAGQTVAHAHGGLETGWASGKGFGTLSAARGTQNHRGDPGAYPTPEGKAFYRYLKGVKRHGR